MVWHNKTESEEALSNAHIQDPILLETDSTLKTEKQTVIIQAVQKLESILTTNT